MASRHQKSVKKWLGISNLGQMSMTGKVLTLAKSPCHIYLLVPTQVRCVCLHMQKLRYEITFMGLDQALHRITVNCKFNEVMVSNIRR